jgi:hypothetical protein
MARQASNKPMVNLKTWTMRKAHSENYELLQTSIKLNFASIMSKMGTAPKATAAITPMATMNSENNKM